MTRRELLKLGGILAAGAALPGGTAKVFASGAEKLLTTTRIVWIQAQSCTGDSVSLLNTADPEPVELLTRFISLVVHQTVGAAQGQTFMDLLDKAREQGDYILVVEGSLPLSMPEACTIGGRTVEELLVKLVPAAKAVVAVGTCAAFGGIPAAEGNPTGSGSVQDFMNKHQIPFKDKLINCPSCPTHPKCLVGTLAYVAAKGYPAVDPKLLTPTMFYGHSAHDECPRYHYYERKISPSTSGTRTAACSNWAAWDPSAIRECPHRQWNGGVNWCVRASAPLPRLHVTPFREARVTSPSIARVNTNTPSATASKTAKEEIDESHRLSLSKKILIVTLVPFLLFGVVLQAVNLFLTRGSFSGVLDRFQNSMRDMEQQTTADLMQTSEQAARDLLREIYHRRRRLASARRIRQVRAPGREAERPRTTPGVLLLRSRREAGAVLESQHDPAGGSRRRLGRGQNQQKRRRTGQQGCRRLVALLQAPVRRRGHGPPEPGLACRGLVWYAPRRADQGPHPPECGNPASARRRGNRRVTPGLHAGRCHASPGRPPSSCLLSG